MTLTLRGKSGELRRGGAFSISLCVHMAVLVWLALSATLNFGEKPQSISKHQPPQLKITWYHLQTRIPNVRPAEAKLTPKPPRAIRKLDQNLIAGAKDLPTPPQKVWVPDPPKADLPKLKPEPLPNLLAVAAAPKIPLKKFAPPPPRPPTPDPRPPIQDAPEAALRQSAITAKPLPIAMDIPRPVRAFVPPPATPRPAPAQRQDIAAPEAAPLVAPSPTMAIVGLDPAKTMDIPKPPPPRDAGFSAGPKPNPDGDSAPASRATLTLPSIYADGGAKDLHPLTASVLGPTSQQNLMAAMRMGGVPRLPASAAPSAPHAPHVSSSPDPRMNGRMIYMMAIQMPNITSFSGSWMVWFAEHEPLPGAAPLAMRAPEPMRKVDPRYIPDAAKERVEGIVRLTAVIRKDGHIDGVELLKHLDDRLDQSAVDALAKWRFEPAQRDGTPVDVDAVFEIPFRLAPKAAR